MVELLVYCELTAGIISTGMKFMSYNHFTSVSTVILVHCEKYVYFIFFSEIFEGIHILSTIFLANPISFLKYSASKMLYPP